MSLYTPAAFQLDDPETLAGFIETHAFGLLQSARPDGEIDSTFTPLLLSQDRQLLRGHIARANPHWKQWKPAQPVQALFQGPHTYISPSDYASTFNVPTWNYTVVQVNGDLEIVRDREAQIDLMHALVETYEADRPQPWRFDPKDERLEALLAAIVFFEIRIHRWHGKFKLNQNKSDADRQSVIAHLESRREADATAVARWMREIPGAGRKA